MPDLQQRLASVQEAVADAARAADRDPRAITTVVVTKFHPASLVRELAELGVRNFGESRHQEAQPKIADLSDIDATWHFIGQLQSKKARQVREYADVIHSVDRESLLNALSVPEDVADVPDVRDVFIQLNLTEDPARGGVHARDLDRFAAAVASTPGLRLRGLMAVAGLESEPRAQFATVRELGERLALAHPAATELSMGMSGDFREAIAEGATHLRIGTAITGNRPTHG